MIGSKSLLDDWSSKKITIVVVVACLSSYHEKAINALYELA